MPHNCKGDFTTLHSSLLFYLKREDTPEWLCSLVPGAQGARRPWEDRGTQNTMSTQPLVPLRTWSHTHRDEHRPHTSRTSVHLHKCDTRYIIGPTLQMRTWRLGKSLTQMHAASYGRAEICTWALWTLCFPPHLAELPRLCEKRKNLLLWPFLLFSLGLLPHSWWLKGPFNSTGFTEALFIPHWLNCNLWNKSVGFQISHFSFLCEENIYGFSAAWNYDSLTMVDGKALKNFYSRDGHAEVRKEHVAAWNCVC